MVERILGMGRNLGGTRDICALPNFCSLEETKVILPLNTGMTPVGLAVRVE